MKLSSAERTGRVIRLRQPLVLALLLAVITLAVYYPALNCDFVNYDDGDYFYLNPHVLSGLNPSNVAWGFTSGFSANWHPLTWFSLMLDAELFGRGPFGPHLVNIILHALNQGLLLLLLLRLTGKLWPSLLVAGLFALHPLHVESVAWISERKDVLSTSFLLLTLLAYHRYVELKKLREESTEPEGQLVTAQAVGPAPAMAPPGSPWAGAVQAGRRVPGWAWYGAALVLFALGLMSKPMLVTLPFLLLLLDYWPLGRFALFTRKDVVAADVSFRFLLLEKLPFFALSAVSCAVTFLVQQRSGAVFSVANFPVLQRIGNASVSYARYLGKTFWPSGLALPYPPAPWDTGVVVCSILLVVGLSAGALWVARKRPYVPVGWFWFVGTLVPVLGLVQVGTQSMADRYTYVPHIGLFIALSWGLWESLSTRPRLQLLVSLLAGAMLLACAVATRLQLRFWQDGETLFTHAVAVTGNNWVAQNQLGSALAKKGRLKEAVACYQRALEIRPDTCDSWVRLAQALSELGEKEQAISSLNRCLELKPRNPDALATMGTILAKYGDTEEAIDYLERCLEANPRHSAALYNLGNALAKKGDWEHAILNYRRSLQVNAAQIDVLNNLGLALLSRKEFAEAIATFEEALELEPDNANAHNNLGTVLFVQGRFAEAALHYREAVRGAPGDARLYVNLGDALVRAGQAAEAAQRYAAALQLNPGDVQTRRKLQMLTGQQP